MIVVDGVRRGRVLECVLARPEGLLRGNDVNMDAPVIRLLEEDGNRAEEETSIEFEGSSPGAMG